MSTINLNQLNVCGIIKPMNAVNNGPMSPNPNSSTTNFPAYKAAEFPYARLHDAPINWGWAHTVDITCVFPDFDADVNDPDSYNSDNNTMAFDPSEVDRNAANYWIFEAKK